MPEANRSAFARLFSFSTLLVSLFLTLVFFLCVSRPLLADPDIWWHLRNAQSLIQSHAFIHTDAYTFTVAGKPWINPEWLSELPYYFAWRWFGLRGLEVVTIVSIEAVVLGVTLLCWQRTSNIKSALLACVFFLPMIAVSLGPRTLLFGWLCLIAELALLWEHSRGHDWLWSLPILFTIWINAHGSWPVGILFFAVYVAAGLFSASWGSILVEKWLPRTRGKLLLLLSLSVAALFLNPYGWRLVAYPFHITFSHTLTVNTVEEWQSLNFHAFPGKLVYLLLVALLFANMARKRTWPLRELLFVLIAVVAGFTYTRLLIMTGIVLCPLLARELTFFRRPDGQSDRPILNLAIGLALAVICVSQLPSQSKLRKQIAAAYPDGAASYLRAAKLQGPLLNDFGWGGYLEWNDPSVALFIDTRADIFDEYGVLREYLDVTNILRPIEVIDQYDIRYALFPRKAPIVYLLTHTSQWITLYQDDTAILLERTEIPN